jgi:hypothetical protein
MNKLFACLALAFIAPIFGSLYADDDSSGEPEQYEPPPPVGMDVDYLAPPKEKLIIGFRILSGPKVSYSGGAGGIIPSGDNPTPDVNGIRRYNDGFVDPDARTDAVTGLPLQQSPRGDGRSNTWSFDSASQIDNTTQVNGTPIGGVDMHSYSGTITGTNSGSGRAASGAGFELTFDRDFGWHWGRVQFDVIGGLGMNKINYSRTSTVAGMMTVSTDAYQTYNAQLDGNDDPLNDTNGNEFYGELNSTNLAPGTTPTSSATNTPGSLPPPTGVNGVAPVSAAPNQPPPYTAPSSGTDSNNQTVDNSTLIASSPIASTTALPVPILVTEQVNIIGAYYTLRAGIQMSVPITQRFSVNMSGGPALVYVGTNLTVDQTITPPTGSPISSTVTDDYSTALPAYFGDANIDYSVTDTTDVYLGAAFQSSTSYNQTINNPNGSYTDKVDFGNQEGVRGGISFKF